MALCAFHVMLATIVHLLLMLLNPAQRAPIPMKLEQLHVKPVMQVTPV